MILINRTELADFEWRRPNTDVEAELCNALRFRAHSAREFRCVRSCIVAARVAITKIEVEPVVAEVFQVLR